MYFLIVILAVFFALNMGGASFGSCFAAAFGGKVLSQWKAGLLFLTFVIIGSVLFGEHVSVTLGNKIIPASEMTHKALIVIFLSAGMSMFISNLMKIPQSTSLVTVAAIAGVGFYSHHLNVATITYLLPFWIILPIASFLLTHYITGFVYPPRKRNFWIYEQLINQRAKLRKFVIIAGCYSAFSVGTNNVANVVGPLSGLGNFALFHGLLICAFFYGLGAFIFTGPLKTASDEIVPLGLLTASIISLVSGTLMLIASLGGIPQSFVMLQMGAIFAVSSIKHGNEETFASPIAKKTLYAWTINPVITFCVAFILSSFIVKFCIINSLGKYCEANCQQCYGINWPNTLDKVV